MDATNDMRNVNTTTSHCYVYPSDLPAFNFETFGTDAVIGASATNAEFANFGQLSGGANNFVATHGWGYVGPPYTGNGQPELRAAYGYYVSGTANLTAARTDDPRLAWIRQERHAGAGNVFPKPATVSAPGSGGTAGYQIVTGTSGTGTKATYLVYVLPTGVIAGSALPINLGVYSVNPTFPDAVTGAGLTGATITATMANGPNYGDGSNIIGGQAVFTGPAPSTVIGLSLGDGIFTLNMVGADFSGFYDSSKCVAQDSGSMYSGWNIQENQNCWYGSTLSTNQQVSVTGSIGSISLGGAGGTGDSLTFFNNGTSYISCGQASPGLCNLQAAGKTVAQLTGSGLRSITAYNAASNAIPTCNSGLTGTWANVTDATSPTYRGAYTSGGTVNTLVYCDGSSWTTH